MEKEDMDEKQINPATCAIWIKEEPPEDLYQEYDKDSDLETAQGSSVKEETHDPLVGNELDDRAEQENSDEYPVELSQERLFKRDPEHIIVDAEPPFNEGPAEGFTNKSFGNETSGFQGARVAQESISADGKKVLKRKRIMKKIPVEQNEESSTSPKLPKQKQTKEDNIGESSAMDTAVHLLKIAAAKLNAPSEEDEVTTFFKYVSTKVKKYSPEIRKGVQQSIFNLLMKAD